MRALPRGAFPESRAAAALTTPRSGGSSRARRASSRGGKIRAQSRANLGMQRIRFPRARSVCACRALPSSPAPIDEHGMRSDGNNGYVTRTERREFRSSCCPTSRSTRGRGARTSHAHDYPTRISAMRAAHDASHALHSDVLPADLSRDGQGRDERARADAPPRLHRDLHRDAPSRRAADRRSRRTRPPSGGVLRVRSANPLRRSVPPPRVPAIERARGPWRGALLPRTGTSRHASHEARTDGPTYIR